MAGHQSPGEALEALFSHVEAAERPEFSPLPRDAYAFLGALSAFRALGLVSESEHQHWQRRVSAEMARLTDPERVQELKEWVAPGSLSWEEPDAKRAALSLLQDITGDLHRTREALLATGTSASGELGWRGYGAVEALHHVGLLDEDERLEWNKRVAQVLTAGMPEVTRVREPAITRDPAVPVTFGAADHQRPPSPRLHPHRTFSGIGPRTLLGVDADARARHEPSLQQVELFEDGVVVTWTEIRESGNSLRNQPRVGVRDDVATEYLMHSGGGSSFGDVIRSHQVFVPAMPDTASMLEVQIEDTAWRLALDAQPRG